MGAETSTLQSIESLNATLNDIETKLGVVEDIHLHHERTICHDDAVLVSGKLIRCNSGTVLNVGPIVGLVGQYSARILVEVDSDANITLNVFIIDDRESFSRFQSETTVTARAGIPVACTVANLLPDTHYAIYIGGINSEAVLLNYASFKTLPVAVDAPVRVIFTHSERIDNSIPGEVNLHEILSTQIKDDDHKWRRHCSRNVVTPTTEAELLESGVHMIVHDGDFVNVDAILQSRALNMLDALLRDDCGLDMLYDSLAEAEAAIRKAYRSACSHPSVRTLFKRCGNLFLAGQGESASFTTSLLMAGPKLQRSSTEPATSAAQDDTDDNSSMASSSVMTGTVATPSVATAKMVFEMDSEIPSTDPHGAAHEELRLLLLGTLLRMARRVCWAYTRQLWDEEYAQWAAHDIATEEFHSMFLKTRKQILVKKSLFETLRRSKLQLTDVFGEGYKATEQIGLKMDELDVDILKLEASFRELLLHGAESLVSKQETLNGGCLHFGATVILLIDTSWEWLGNDGRVEKINSRFVAVHPKILAKFESIANDNEVIGSSLAISSGAPLTTGDASSTALVDKVPLKFLIVVSTAPLIDTGFIPSANRTPEEPQPFRPSKLDCHVLLKTFSRWQQRAPERAVLLVQATGSFAAKGIAKPYTIPYSGTAGVSGNGISDSDGLEEQEEEDPRAVLIQLALGRMDRRHSPKMHKIAGEENISDPSSFVPDGELIVDKIAGFQAQFDAQSISTKRSYWDVMCVPITPVERNYRANHPDFTTKREFSGFSCKFVTDVEPVLAVTMGPVIGRVTHSSACILLEVASDSVVQVLVVDQLTGVEHRCERLTSAHKPTIFTFDALIGHRSYDVMVSGHSARAFRQSGSVSEAVPFSRSEYSSLVWGTFTTQRNPGPAAIGTRGNGSEDPAHEELEERRITLGLRNQVKISGTSAGPGGVLLKGGVGSQVTTTHPHAKLRVRTRCKVLILGENSPSSRRLLVADEDEEEENEATKGGLGDDRLNLIEGVQLCKAIVDVASRPLTEIELVIHCSFGVDLRSGYCRAAMNLLSRAEAILQRTQKPATKLQAKSYDTFGLHRTHISDVCSTLDSIQSDEAAVLLLSAEDSIRMAYRLHWGASSVRSLFEHSAHVFVGSPSLDILNAFNSPSLWALASDTSQFCVSQLLRIVTKLHSEYQSSLWAADYSTYRDQEEMSKIHQISSGRGLIFTLHPRVVYHQDNLGAPSDNLIPEQQLAYLQNTLQHSVDMFPRAMTLILCSPLPLVSEDPTTKDFSFLTTDYKGTGYTTYEVNRLLDILAAWMHEDSNREVIVVCGGVSIGFESNIEITDLHSSSAAAANDTTIGHDVAGEIMQTTMKITQICCGPVVGVVDYRLPPKEAIYHSNTRKFHFKLRSVHHRPHCAMISLNSNQDGSHRRATSSMNELPDLRRLVAAAQAGERNPGDEDESPLSENVLLHTLWNEVVVQLSSSVASDTASASAQEAIDRFDNKGLGNESNVEAEIISRAIRAACTRCSISFRECHELFSNELLFGLPSNGGLSVQQCFLSACLWVLDRMPPELRAVCPTPSTFAIRHVWLKFCEEFGHSNSSIAPAATESQAPTEITAPDPIEAAVAVGQSQAPLADRDINTGRGSAGKSTAAHHHHHYQLPTNQVLAGITATLCADGRFFQHALSQMIEAQGLLEHFSYTHGFPDGWE